MVATQNYITCKSVIPYYQGRYRVCLNLLLGYYFPQNIDFEDEEARPAVLILGNKSDLPGERKVSPEMGEEMARNFGALFAEVSAKSGAGVQEVRNVAGIPVIYKNKETCPVSQTYWPPDTMASSFSLC